MAALSISILDKEERRDFARLIVDEETRAWVRNTNPFVVSGAAGEQSIDGVLSRIADISFSGARVLIPSPCGSEGDTVEIRLRCNSKEPLILEGRIVRAEHAQDEHAMGVHFYNMAVRDQQSFAEALYGWSRLPANAKGVRRSPIAPMKRRLAV